MIKVYATAVFALFAPTLYANEYLPADSIAGDTAISRDLQEFVVTASPVIHKADRDIYSPSADARKYSDSGLSLLQNMRIPALSVNTILNSVSNPGGSVQLRINGRTADIQEVRNLSPDNVVKVEYLENPGLRYEGANAVLNFIVRNPTVGGSMSLYAMLWAKNMPSGNYSADLKFNSGKSQWNIYNNTQIRHRLPMHRDYDETFRFADGSILKRVETPIGGMYNNNQMWSGISYSYTNPQKTTLWTGVRLNHQNPNTSLYEGMLETVTGSDKERHYLSSASFNMFLRPVLEFYLDHKIGRGQTLVFDLTGSYHYGKPVSEYIESPDKDAEPTSDIVNSIIDNNFGFSFEGNYIKEWDKATATGGVRWNGSRNRSRYISAGDAIFHQRQDAAYFFGEYTRRIGNVSLTGGVGAQYTDIFMRESGQGTHSWDIQPRISVMWRKDWSTLRATFRRTSANPSLSQTNPVVQQIDPVQFQFGNPELKPYSWLRGNISWGINIPRLNINLSAKIRSARNPVFKYSYWENDRLMQTYSNDGSYLDFGFNLAADFEIIPTWLFFQGNIGFSRQYSRGKNFKHIISSWGGGGDLILRHWGFNLLFQFNQAQNSLWAQQIERLESFNLFMLQYTWKDYNAGVFLMMPFGRYNQETSSLDANYSFTGIMRSPFIERMFGFSLSATIKWGKQKRDARRLLQGSDNVGGSSVGGR